VIIHLKFPNIPIHFSKFIGPVCSVDSVVLLIFKRCNVSTFSDQLAGVKVREKMKHQFISVLMKKEFLYLIIKITFTAMAETPWGLQLWNACSSVRFFTRGFRLRNRRMNRRYTVGTESMQRLTKIDCSR